MEGGRVDGPVVYLPQEEDATGYSFQPQPAKAESDLATMYQLYQMNGMLVPNCQGSGSSETSSDDSSACCYPTNQLATRYHHQDGYTIPRCDSNKSEAAESTSSSASSSGEETVPPPYHTYHHTHTQQFVLPQRQQQQQQKPVLEANLSTIELPVIQHGQSAMCGGPPLNSVYLLNNRGYGPSASSSSVPPQPFNISSEPPLIPVPVPVGWKRLFVEGSIIYLSPSSIALSSMDQLKMYLQTPGVCKCGLECPLNCDVTFNFNPKVASRPWSQADADMTKLCNHKRKTGGNAVQHAIPVPAAAEVEVKDVVPTKRKKKKHSGYSGVSVSQLLAQRERDLAAAAASAAASAQRWQTQQQQPQDYTESVTYSSPNAPPVQPLPIMQKPRSIPPWHNPRLAVPPQPAATAAAKKPLAVVYDRVPSLQQHMPPPSYQEPEVIKKKQHKALGKNKKRGGGGVHEVQPSFMDDPNAYLAQQTALLHNTIHSTQQRSHGHSHCPLLHSALPPVYSSVPLHHGGGPLLDSTATNQQNNYGSHSVQHNALMHNSPAVGEQHNAGLLYNVVQQNNVVTQNVQHHDVASQHGHGHHPAKVTVDSVAQQHNTLYPSRTQLLQTLTSQIGQQNALLDNTVHRNNSLLSGVVSQQTAMLHRTTGGQQGALQQPGMMHNRSQPCQPGTATLSKAPHHVATDGNPYEGMRHPQVYTYGKCERRHSNSDVEENPVTSSTFSNGDPATPPRTITSDTRPIQGGAISTSNGSPQPQASPTAVLRHDGSSPTSTTFVLPRVQDKPRQQLAEQDLNHIKHRQQHHQQLVKYPSLDQQCLEQLKYQQSISSTLELKEHPQQLQHLQQQQQQLRPVVSMAGKAQTATVSFNASTGPKKHEVMQQDACSKSVVPMMTSKNQMQAGHILVSSSGPYIVTSKPQVLPVTQQVLSQPAVLVNTLQAPFVLQPSVMAVDTGLGHLAVTGNMLQGGIMADGEGKKSKKGGKKRKGGMIHMSPNQGVVVNQGFGQQNYTLSPGGNIQPLQAALTLVQGKLMNSQFNQQINLLQPVNLAASTAFQQFIVPNNMGMVMSTDGTGAIISPDTNIGVQLQLQNVLTPVQNTGFLAAPTGMLLRAPQPPQPQKLSPQFISHGSGGLMVNQFQGQLSPLIATANLSPSQPPPRHSPIQQQNTTVVQQNTTIVQQQTTMVSNKPIEVQLVRESEPQHSVQHSVSTQTAGSESHNNTHAPAVLTSNTFCQTMGSVGWSGSPPDTTTHSPVGLSEVNTTADTTTVDDCLREQLVSSSSLTDMEDRELYTRLSVDETAVSSHSDVRHKPVMAPPPGVPLEVLQALQMHRRHDGHGTGALDHGGHPGMRTGELVFGPARGCPAWPGKLVTDPGDSLDGRVWVRWFGGGTLSPPTRVNLSELQSLSQGLDAQHSLQQSNTGKRNRKLNTELEAAIQEAMLELDKMAAQQRKPASGRPRRTQR